MFVDDNPRDLCLLIFCKFEVASTRQIVEDGYDLSLPDDPGQLPSLPSKLAQLLLYLQRDLKALEQMNRLELDGIDLRSFSDITSSMAFLKTMLRKRLNQYSTTIAQDQAGLSDVFLTPRKRMAIEVRLGEKEVLAVWLQGINIVTNNQIGQASDIGQQSKRNKP